MAKAQVGGAGSVGSIPLTLEMLHSQIMALQLRLEKAEADLEQMKAYFLTHTHNYNVPSLSLAPLQQARQISKSG